jgi:hypothetical protein
VYSVSHYHTCVVTSTLVYRPARQIVPASLEHSCLGAGQRAGDDVNVPAAEVPSHAEKLDASDRCSSSFGLMPPTQRFK